MWKVECGAALPDRFIRNVFCDPSKVNGFRFKHKNVGVYVSTYAYEDCNAIETCNMIGDIYFDLDGDLDNRDGFVRVRDDALKTITYIERVLCVPTPLINIYFSGCKGIHITVPHTVFGLEPCQDLNNVYKYIVSDIVKCAISNDTLDTRIYDRRRLFRMPHSKHNKTGLYKIPLLKDELSSLDINRIRTMASQPRAMPQTDAVLAPKAKAAFESMASAYRSSITRRVTDAPTTPIKVTPPCIKHLLENNTARGQRNNTAIALCSFFRQAGIGDDEAMARLSNWSQSHCTPPLSDAELAAVTKSAYDKGYKFGCSTLKELSVCVPEKCELCSAQYVY